MDVATIGGLIIGIGAVLVSFLMEGGHLSAIVQPPAMLIVIGGTIGASIVTTSLKTLLKIHDFLRLAFTGAVRQILTDSPEVFDPRKIIGEGREAIKQVVKSKMEAFGSAGRA